MRNGKVNNCVVCGCVGAWMCGCVYVWLCRSANKIKTLKCKTDFQNIYQEIVILKSKIELMTLIKMLINKEQYVYIIIG